MQDKNAQRSKQEDAAGISDDELRLRKSTVTLHPDYDYGEEALLPPVPIYAPETVEVTPPPQLSLPPRRSHDNVLSVAQLFAIGLVLGLLSGAWEALSERTALAARVPAGELPSAPSTQLLPYSLLFGPEAMSACAERCDTGNPVGAVACLRACSRLSYTQFGRRVLLTEPQPEEAAGQVEELCLPQIAPIYMRQSPTIWRSFAGRAVDTLRTAQVRQAAGDPALLSAAYKELGRAAADLARTAPRSAGARELHRSLLHVLCLRSHLTLTEIALEIASARSDSFSERFYASLHHALGPRVLEQEAAVLHAAEKLKLSYETR